MPQSDTTRCLGLIVQYNPLQVADGALSKADDCVIRRENTIENRRGYKSYGTLSNPPTQLFVFNKTIVAHNSTSLSCDNGSGTFNSYNGSFSAPSGRLMRTEQALSNCYLATSAGIQVIMDTNAPLTTTGNTTNGNNQLTNLAATTNIVAGKAVSGTGIPAGTTVSSISGTTVTLSKNATASNTGTSVTFTSVARSAGAPRALNPSYTLSANTTGFLADQHQCAYRIVIERIDQNSNVLFGYPSERLWVDNRAGSTQNVILTVYLPSDAVAGDIIQVYRTQTIADGSADGNGVVSDIAGDEMNVVYQYTLSASDISTGNISVTDIVLNALAANAASLYTSPSQEGISQANARPPLSKDLALYKSNTMFYANTQTIQQLYVTMLSATQLGTKSTAAVTNTSTSVTLAAANSNIVVGMKVYDRTTSANIAAGTTVAAVSGTSLTLSQAAAGTGGTDVLVFVSARTMTLDGTTYSFVAGPATYGGSTDEDATTGKIGVATTGTAAYDIQQTAQSMCRVINRYATNTDCYAYYISGPSDLPGQMLIQQRSLGGSAFTISVSNSEIQGAFFPQPPVGSATATASTSSNSVQNNALFYSKLQQPEAVPLLNYFLVGPANENILRIKALRDSLIVIKENGVHRLTGDTSANFNVVPLDLTAFCKAVDSVVSLANQVFMLSNQGVVAISDTGVQVVSREIEPKILPLLTYSNISNAYGIAYESERSYILSVPSTSSDTANTQTFVFNIFTRAWVRWTFGITTGVVEANADLLYFGKSAASAVYSERKAFTNADYSDPEYTATVSSISGSTIQFTVSGASPAVGWLLSQGGTNILISSIVQNGSSWTATMKSTPPASWTTGAMTLYPPVNLSIEWDAWSAGSPGTIKQVSQFQVFTDSLSGNDTISSLTATFRSDLDNTTETQAITNSASGWGSPWGSFVWGGTSETFRYPTWAPKKKSYCRILYTGVQHSNAQEKISINGCSRTFEPVSERGSK